MARAKQTIDENKLSHWKLLDELRRCLANVMESTEPKQKSPGGPERLLLQEDYFSLMLFVEHLIGDFPVRRRGGKTNVKWFSDRRFSAGG